MTRAPDTIYVASRASVPARGEMWRAIRARGANIISTWIDEDGEGQTASMPDLWKRIIAEVARSSRLVLYVEPEDFPLKGALIEVGAALAFGRPVRVVAPGVAIEPRSMRPLGSWASHPLVSFWDDAEAAVLTVKVPGPGEPDYGDDWFDEWCVEQARRAGMVPCPFCGKPPWLMQPHESQFVALCPESNDCEMFSVECIASTAVEAATKWNTRCDIPSASLELLLAAAGLRNALSVVLAEADGVAESGGLRDELRTTAESAIARVDELLKPRPNAAMPMFPSIEGSTPPTA